MLFLEQFGSILDSLVVAKQIGGLDGNQFCFSFNLSAQAHQPNHHFPLSRQSYPTYFS